MGVTFTFVFTILWRFLCMKMQSDEKKIEIENGKASACLLISNRMSFWSESILCSLFENLTLTLPIQTEYCIVPWSAQADTALFPFLFQFTPV